MILLAPLSDYVAALATTDPKTLKKAVSFARDTSDRGKPHNMMPDNLCSYPHDAQRFLSLYTSDSVEEIFSYATVSRKPKILQKVKVPLFAIFAADDEYQDRPTAKIVEWFMNAMSKQKASFEIINGAPHNFKGFSRTIVKLIKSWMR